MIVHDLSTSCQFFHPISFPSPTKNHLITREEESNRNRKREIKREREKKIERKERKKEEGRERK